jgi:tetratricopeptide (TPR) repeat protein
MPILTWRGYRQAVGETFTGGPADGFGSWLRRRRDELSVTQEMLADKAGVAVRTIRYLEAGRTRPRPHTRGIVTAALAQLAGPGDVGHGRAGDGGPGDGEAGTRHAGEVRRNGHDPYTPAQLPPDVATFVGRGQALRKLDRLAAEVDVAATTGLIVGAPGIGKTTIAVHWAHRVKHRFPDGQLFADLKGFGAATTPEDPDEVLQGFLEALGVPAERMPRRPADRIGLYRTALAGRRVLVILDNAAAANQVRGLLPGSPGSLVVVTSRHQMLDLIAVDGARPLLVPACTPAEGEALLAARLGTARIRSEPVATAEIVRLCAGMPLALGVVAARAAVNPRFTLDALSTELRDAQAGGLGADVRSAMSWSYRSLGEPAARVFRTLGLHPRPDVTACVVAGVAEVPLAGARDALAELAEAHLVMERRPGRFTMHDVVHSYAREIVERPQDDAVRHDTRARMYDHYAYLAATAAARLCAHQEEVGERPSMAGSIEQSIRDPDEAVTVLLAEQDVLYDVLRDAVRNGAHRQASHIASSLFVFLERRGHWRSLIEIARLATTAADELGDVPRRLAALRLMARAHVRVTDGPTAGRYFRAALRLSEGRADRAAEAAVRFDLALWSESEGRYADSLHDFAEALAIYRQIDDVAGEASALNAIGWGRLQLGEPEAAVRYCRRALVLHGIAGNPHGEASTLDTVGLAHHRAGAPDKAIDAYQSALRLTPATGDRHLESTILEHLGDAWESAGDVVRARTTRDRALSVLDDISPALAGALRARLRLAAAR